MEQLSLFDLTRKSGLVVEQIDRERAKPFIEGIHYSRIFPNNIVYSFGLYEDGELIGVVTYGIPASPSLCIGLAGKENRDRVLELNRLAIKPNRGGQEPSIVPCVSFVEDVAKQDICGKLCGYWVGTRWICVSSNEFLVHRDVSKACGYLSARRKA